MALTSLTTRFSGRGSVRFEFSSDLPDPTFYLYRDKRLVQQTKGGALTVHVDEGVIPLFELFDSPQTFVVQENDGRVRIEFDRWSDAKEYSIERNDGGWAEVVRIVDTGQSHYGWTSEPLPDGTLAEYRVTAMGWNGAQTTLSSVNRTIIRVPEIPIVTASLQSSAGNAYLNITALS